MHVFFTELFEVCNIATNFYFFASSSAQLFYVHSKFSARRERTYSEQLSLLIIYTIISAWPSPKLKI